MRRLLDRVIAFKIGIDYGESILWAFDLIEFFVC